MGVGESKPRIATRRPRRSPTTCFCQRDCNATQQSLLNLNPWRRLLHRAKLRIIQKKKAAHPLPHYLIPEGPKGRIGVKGKDRRSSAKMVLYLRDHTERPPALPACKSTPPGGYATPCLNVRRDKNSATRAARGGISPWRKGRRNPRDVILPEIIYPYGRPPALPGP